MSTFTRSASASPDGRREPDTRSEHEDEEQENLYDEEENLYDEEDEEENDLCGTPVRVKTPEQAPAQVDQYSDPPESPSEFRMEYVKENGVTGFMLKVASRLRTLPDPHERVRVRHQFWGVIRDLQVDTTAWPPYDQQAAERIRHLLEERGLAETLLLDFELLLNLWEERAQENRERAEKRRHELDKEQRKKQEWDVVKQEDAEEEWELI